MTFLNTAAKSQLSVVSGPRFEPCDLVSIFDWDLIEWRREVLDEDDADDGEVVGPNAECGPQTTIHRLSALSKLFQDINYLESASKLATRVRFPSPAPGDFNWLEECPAFRSLFLARLGTLTV